MICKMSANSKLVFALIVGLGVSAANAWAQQPGIQKAFGDSFTVQGNQERELPVRETSLRLDSAACNPTTVEADTCPNAWFTLPNPLNGRNARGLTKIAIDERDRLLSLAALAVVHEDWQFMPEAARGRPEGRLARRGHNIGGVLVDDAGNLVWWERNSNGVECNGTNHGETRMMISYMNFARRSTLGCHSIYTSLEPCAMCSGMMTQQKIARTVYVQNDHGFGAALERLHQPFTPRGFQCGFPRAPRSKQSTEVNGAALAQSVSLDREFHAFIGKRLASPDQSVRAAADDLTAFLQTNEAKAVYESATRELTDPNTKVQPENQVLLAQIRNLILDVQTIYARTNTTISQHVKIERERRIRPLPRTPHAGLQVGEPADPCCRPALMDGTRLPGAAPAFCRGDTPALVLPVAQTPPRR